MEIRRALGSGIRAGELQALGTNLDEQGRSADAIPLLREAAEIAHAVNGPTIRQH